MKEGTVKEPEKARQALYTMRETAEQFTTSEALGRLFMLAEYHEIGLTVEYDPGWRSKPLDDMGKEWSEPEADEENRGYSVFVGGYGDKSAPLKDFSTAVGVAFQLFELLAHGELESETE